MTTPSLPADTPGTDTARHQRLSSLADADWAGLGAGGRESVDVSAALAGWRQDASARQTWHTYHLIGDVMRSDDLARPAQQDQDFLARLRTRLEAEPAHVPAAAQAKAAAVVVDLSTARQLQQPQQVRSPQRWGRWQAGVAMAASVAVLAVVLSLNQAERPLPGTGGPVVAGGADAGGGAVGAATGAAVGAAVGAPVAVVNEPAAMVNAGGVLRDPRLDEFLRLHQMARGGLPMGAPGGSLQRADLQMPADTGR